MSPYFDAAFQLVVGVEGGYVYDPNDPGGETKWGISKAAYPTLDIASLTETDAQGIYYRDYWLPLNLDSKTWATALLKFDAAVNQGPSYAKTLPDDPHDLAVARAVRYATNPNMHLYGKGWFNRLFSMFTQSMESPQ